LRNPREKLPETSSSNRNPCRGLYPAPQTSFNLDLSKSSFKRNLNGVFLSIDEVAVGKTFAAIILVALIYPNSAFPQHIKRSPESATRSGDAPVVDLSFKDFFDPAASELRPSRKVLDLIGKHVRLVGFMTQMDYSGSFDNCIGSRRR